MPELRIGPAAPRPIRYPYDQYRRALKNMIERAILSRAWTLLAVTVVLCSSGTLHSQEGATANEPATAPSPGATSGEQPAPAPVGSTAVARPAPTSGATGPDYIIGPGDTLQVFVWRNPELSGSVPVRPDGKISTPLVEDMVAVGKTPSQLARDIETSLSEYVRSPKVNVIVSVPASTFSQVKVVGQVKNPQSIPYREGLKVLDVLLLAGGTTEFAAPNRAKIVRSVNGKERDIKIHAGDLINGGDMSQNVTLLPGDVLVIPQSRF
jgi:polysaccharide biosynthesis/export protein